MIWNRILALIRNILPVGRTYLDKKIEYAVREEKENCDRQAGILEKQTGMLEKQTETFERQLQKFMKEFREEQAAGFQKINEQLDQKFVQQEQLGALLKEIRREQKAGFQALNEHMNREFQRRDQWGARAEQFRLEANGRPWWVIKCPAPEDASRVRWGDYPYALSLKRYLEREGIYVSLDMREDWGCEAQADVVLVLRGCRFYLPDRRSSARYLMWNISHPNDVTEAEYELYDAVCAGSHYYAEQLKKKLKVPVFALLQCTDTELFHPGEQTEDSGKWDYIFVGNSRGIARNSVMWAIEDGLPFRIWGSGWNTILKDHMDLVVAQTIENSRLPELYRSAKVILNDHWSDMLEKQFINNRIFDALACGIPVISDRSAELERIFPKAVLYYSNKEEFEHCVKRMETEYAQIKECAEEQWTLIQEHYSFAARAKELVEIVKSLQEQKAVKEPGR